MGSRTATYEWQKLRWQILERDAYTCQYCGQFAPNVVLEVDHKTAVADGGTNDPSNLVTSCRSCNQGKEYSFRPTRIAVSVVRERVAPRPKRVAIKQTVPVRDARLTGRPRSSDSVSGQVRVMLEMDPFLTPNRVVALLNCNYESAKKALFRARLPRGEAPIRQSLCWVCGGKDPDMLDYVKSATEGISDRMAAHSSCAAGADRS